MSALKDDRTNLAEWLGWEVVPTDSAVEAFSFRWRDEKTGKWFSRPATDLEVRQYDQVRALAYGDVMPASGPATGWFLGKMKGTLAQEVRALLLSEVNRSNLVETRDGKAQRLGSVLALNAVLHLLGEPQVPVSVAAEDGSLKEAVGVGTPGQVVNAALLLRALRHWSDERGHPRHPSGTRPADRQSGEINGLAIARNVVVALVKGDNPLSRSELGML